MKYVKILIINLFIIFIFLAVIDAVLFRIEKEKYIEVCKNSAGFFDSSRICHYAAEVPKSSIYIAPERQIINKTNNEDAILLLGCSYTYGANLSPNQNFSYYLAKETGLSVYNFGICGGSIQQMLYLSQQKDFLKNYPNVKLIVYTYIADHINRPNEFLKCEIYDPYCNFRIKEENGKYVKASEWYSLPSKFFIFRMFLKSITLFKNKEIFYEYNVSNFVKMVNQTKRNLTSFYPNAKFVFLFFYPGDKKEWTYKFDKDILIMTTDDYVNVDIQEPKYRHNQDYHPSELLWKDTVPDFVKKLREIQYLK